MAEFFSRGSPLDATITGSTTSGARRGARSSSSATARMIAAEYNIPVLMAAMGKALWLSRICSATRLGVMGAIEETRPGTSATTQVMAVWAYPPRAVIVFKSAWAPAPQELSLPAMVRTTGGAAGRGTGGRREDFMRLTSRRMRQGGSTEIRVSLALLVGILGRLPGCI